MYVIDIFIAVNGDFLSLSDQTLILNSTNTPLSVAIPLINDVFFEVTESFRATLLSAVDPTVAIEASINLSEATVTILDDDGESQEQ